MSSPGYHSSPHLHRVNIHPHGKRPFEEYDSDPDTSMPVHTTASGTSSSNNPRFQAATSLTAPHNPETRNKRARSTSTSTSTDDSLSNPSSSGYNTAQSSSRSDIFADGPSALPANALDCPIQPVASAPSFVATQDVHMNELHLPIPPTQSQRTHVPTPSTQEDTFRTSLQRFAEFDRQIAALRTSLAVTRSPPLPSLGPSVDGDPIPSNDHWHPTPSNFLSNGSSGPFPPTVTDPASSSVAVAPSETLDSLSTFTSSNVSANITTATSSTSGSVPSPSFPPTYSNVPRYPPYPSYRPSTGASSSLAERVGDAVLASSTPAFMRPSPNENPTRLGNRSAVSVELSSATPSASHTRHVRRSLSPLVFPPDPSSSSPPSIVTNDVFLRYRTQYEDGDFVRSRRRGVDSPVPSLGHEVTSRLEHHLGEQLWLSQTRFGERARVIREHSSVERESVPSVFDVFNIGELSQDRNRPAPIQESTASRYTSIAEPAPPRVSTTHNDRSRGPAPMSTTSNTIQGHPQDPHSHLHSSRTSIPSSNSLMSESASERRHALALERFRARFRRSSFDADDESESRWSGSSRGERERESSGLGIASPIPPSPSVEGAPGTGTSTHFPLLGATRAPPSVTNRAEPVMSMSPSLQRSFSELFAETQRIAREGGTEVWLPDWDASRVAETERLLERGRDRDQERQLDRERPRERVWEWERERQRERPSQDSRSFVSGLSLPSTSLAREESSHSLPASSAPPRPSLAQLGPVSNTATPNTTASTNNSQQYSYSNLNLSSFQSGLFRDSLRRNAAVDQASLPTSGVVIHSGESRATSGLTFDDSESEVDLDDLVPTRPPSPEWSREHPYAGRTPPPGYSPPRNFSPRPHGFSVLRRGSIVNFDSPRPQHPHRNSTMLSRHIPPAAPGPTRPTSYENSSQPAPSERTERDRFLPARLLESFYRSHEDNRRNTSPGAGQPYHSPHQNHVLASGPNVISRNDVLDARSVNGNNNVNGNRAGPEVVGEHRRSTLGLGGSLRSRFARFANQSSSNATDPASRQRSPPRPIGARPQVAEQRRRGSLVFGGGNALEHEARPEASRSVSGPPHWAVNAGAGEPSVVVRDAPWRASSGPRSTFVPPPPASSSPRTGIVEVASRVEEQRSRLRTLRQRLQLDRGSEGVRVFRPGMLRAIGRRGNMGDYVPDELFDDSYEALLSLSSMLGEVRSRATPEDVIASLPTGTFKEWKKDDSEMRCPICLDDYDPSDVLTRLIECPHWLHKNCLEQWLRTANTCPVCREKVKSSPKPAPARRRPIRESSGPSESNQAASNSTSGNGASRTLHANSQTSNGRPVSFTAVVFDRLTNEGRDGTTELSSSSPQAPPPTRDARSVYLERLRAQHQQQHAREPHQPSHMHDVYPEFPPPHEALYHLRVPPTSQPGSSSSRSAAGAALGGTEGSGARPFGFVSLSRGQGSDSSMSTSSSASMAVDDIGLGPGSRHSMVSPGTGSGPLFLDVPTMTRREPAFSFAPVPLSSGTFGGASSSTASLSQQQQQQPSGFDARPPTMVISSSTEAAREWRPTRGYDALLNMDASRSSSSSSSSVSAPQPRPMSVVNRIPIDEDSLFEDDAFGWNPYGRRLGRGYSNPFEEEPTRRTT